MQGEGEAAGFSSCYPWTSPLQGRVLRVLVESRGERPVGIRPGMLEEVIPLEPSGEILMVQELIVITTTSVE